SCVHLSPRPLDHRYSGFCTPHLRLRPPPTLFPYTTLFRSTTPSSLVVSFRRVVVLDALRWTAAAVLIAFGLYRLTIQAKRDQDRSGENTSELPSRENFLWRLLCEKKSGRSLTLPSRTRPSP